MVVVLFFWALVPTAASKRNVSVKLIDYQYRDAFVSLRLTNRSGQDVICTWKDDDWYGQVLLILNGSEEREQSVLVPKASVREVKLGALLSSDITRRLQMTFTPLTSGNQLRLKKWLRPFQAKLSMFRDNSFWISIDLPPLRSLTKETVSPPE